MRAEVIQGILIPFWGTVSGAGCVLFMRSGLRPAVQRALTGFAAGVMVAASVWSLLVPAMEQAGIWGSPHFSPQWLDFGWASCFFWRWTERSPISIRTAANRKAPIPI